MPTDHEYDRAAREFRGLASNLDDQASWAPSAPASGFVASAPVSRVVDDAQRSAIGSIVRAADELRRLARLCDHRADVCRSYRHAVRVHEATPLEIRTHLPPPVPPAPWVEL